MPGRILIADDRFASRLMLAALFGGAYYEILQADRSESILQIAESELPGAILVSDCMTGPGAIALCEKLKRSEACSAALRIVVTDRSDPAHTAALIGAGADDVISRSSSDSEMLARVRRLFEHKSRMHSLTMQGITNLRPTGLAEARASFASAIRVAIVSNSADAKEWAFEIGIGLRVTGKMSPRVVPPNGTIPADTDVVLVDGESLGHEATLRFTAKTLHLARGDTSEILIVTSAQNQTLAVPALDHGAGGILRLPFDSKEACARITLLHQRKSQISQAMEGLRRGLKSAMLDPLTGLFNRRYTLPKLEQHIADVRGGGPAAAILMCDLDHFKWINDSYGHQAGDKVLQNVANTLSTCLPSAGFAARLGGEEFLMVLPVDSPESAVSFARKVRSIVAQTTTPTPEAPEGLKVTLSIGVSILQGRTVRRHTPLAEESARLLDCADRALYRAKAAGRDCVITDFSQGSGRFGRSMLRHAVGMAAQ